MIASILSKLVRNGIIVKKMLSTKLVFEINTRGQLAVILKRHCTYGDRCYTMLLNCILFTNVFPIFSRSFCILVEYFVIEGLFTREKEMQV